MQLVKLPAVTAASAAVTAGKAMRELRWLTWFPVGAMVVLLLLSMLLPDLARAAALPLAVAGAMVGIPHGAVDHLVPAWWPGSRPRSPRVRRADGARMLCFVIAYTAVAMTALAALLVVPTPTLMAFLVLSAVHFGRGEVVTSAERAGRPVPSTSADWPVTLAHGLAVVGLLVWARPPTTDPFLRPLSPMLADLTAQTRGAGLLLVAVAVGGGALVLSRTRRWLELAELLLLAGTFALAPPLAAFGIYFGGWHAPRHTARLLDLARGARRVDVGTSEAGSGWGPAAAVLGRAAALPSMAALAAVGALWAARDLASIQAEVGVLLALTFPHAAVVMALDRRAVVPSSRASNALTSGLR